MIAAPTPIHEDRRRETTLEVCPRTAESPKIPAALCNCDLQPSLEPSDSASSPPSPSNSPKHTGHTIPIQ